jgi:hypothetical protein
MRRSLALLAGVLPLFVSPTFAAPKKALFSDTFSGYTANVCMPDLGQFGPWFVAVAGYGCTQVVSSPGAGWLDMSPQPSSTPAETHAALVLGPIFAGPIQIQVNALTAAQLRTQSLPNPWEVAWLLWHYTDNEHFYYLILKPNGWELGKEDPLYPGNQRFLASASSPSFPIGTSYAIQVSHDQTNTIRVSVNGRLLTTFTDTERPYGAGQLGLYTEDSHVQFDNVKVSAL